MGEEPEQAARGHYQQGYALYQLKQPDAAIASLGKIAALKANALWKVRADYLLGECYNQQKKYDKKMARGVESVEDFMTGT